MPDLIIWKKQEINKMKRDMDRLLCKLWDDFCIPLLPRGAGEIPHMDLSETDESLVVKAEVPGIDLEDLEISITDNILTIKGEMKQTDVDETEGYQWNERRYGFFSRTVQLPCKILIDDVKATYEKGILNIVMPICKADKTPEIKVKVK
jgi:HSP20 family protein